MSDNVQSQERTQETVVTFVEFNQIRAIRDAAAAKFNIVDEDGDSYFLWMTVKDITENMKQFPNCAEEFQKGLNRYLPFSG